MYVCMHVWSDLFQSVLLPPLLDGLALMSLLPLCLGKGIFCDLLGVNPVRQEVLWQTLGGSLAWLREAVVQNFCLRGSIPPMMPSGCNRLSDLLCLLLLL